MSGQILTQMVLGVEPWHYLCLARFYLSKKEQETSPQCGEKNEHTISYTNSRKLQ